MLGGEGVSPSRPETVNLVLTVVLLVVVVAACSAWLALLPGDSYGCLQQMPLAVLQEPCQTGQQEVRLLGVSRPHTQLTHAKRYV